MSPMGGTCLFGFAAPNHWDEEAAKNILRVTQNGCGLIIPGLVPVKNLVGDCLKVSNVTTAIWRAWDVAMKK